jgi:hypothetical protein
MEYGMIVLLLVAGLTLATAPTAAPKERQWTSA